MTKLRLAALDREAAVEIRRLRATGLSFAEALDVLLASAAGARAFAEYTLLSDALTGEDRFAACIGHTRTN